MHTRLALPCLLLAFALLQASPAVAGEDFPRGQLPAGVAPLRYRLELDIDPRQPGFSGRTTIEVTVTSPTRVIWLHGLGLTGVEASATAADDSIPATWREVDTVTGVARLDLARELPAGPATLHFSYSSTYRDGAEGLYATAVGTDRYVFSQLQAIDARRVFPGFDEPRFKTPFDVTVTAVEGDVVITNAPLATTVPAGGGKVAHRFETTLPLPTYLLAFAVGPLDVVEAPPVPANELRDWPLPLRGIATRGQGPRLAFALANTAFMVESLERYFGLPFPYPKLDLISSPQMGGAMENAGAIIYGDGYLLFGEEAPPAQLRTFGETHAHELAHQWFGDLVTPAWWEDTWLNESFATWLGSKIAMAWRPGLIEGIDLASDALDTMNLDSRAAGRPVREAVTDSRRISSTFDSITYEKGGGVLSMFESYLGEQAFRDGVRLHVRRHLHGTATSDEFFAALAEASGQPGVVDAFRSFVEQPGVPLVSARRQAGGRRLALAQSRYRPIGAAYDTARQWKIPLCMTAYGPPVPQKVCTLLTTPAGEVALPEGTTTFMPNAGGAGYYRFELEAEELERLAAMAGQLPDREALALADSLTAAFRAGQLPFARLLAAAAQLGAHPSRLVSLHLGYELVDIRNRWAGPAERAALAEALVRIYAPRLAALGLDPRAGAYASEEPARRLLRRSLTSLVAVEGGHAPTIAILAEAARKSLEDPAALDAEFREVAWIVGLRQFGAGFAAAMSERVLSSPDPLVRSAAAGALGRAEDPAVSTAALELAIKPGVRVNELMMIAFRQMDGAATRDLAWPWLQRNFDRLASQLPGYAQDFVYALPSSFCDAAQRESVARFLEAGAANSRVSPLRVARTLERMDVCIAQKQALGAQVGAALAGAGS